MPEANQILANAAFGNPDSELQKLNMDPRSAPRRILPTHAADEFASFLRNSRPAEFAVADLPGPERPEQLAAPADDRLWLNNYQPVPPVEAQARDLDPEQTVGCVQSLSLQSVSRDHWEQNVRWMCGGAASDT